MRKFFLIKFTMTMALCMLYSNMLFGANVGLLVMATGKYIQFVPPLIESAEKHFCKNHNVTFFIFTDGVLSPADNVVTIYQPRLGWPFDSMMRNQVYASHADVLLTQDYLFATDADMLFVGDVGDEILGQRVATQHPGFVGKRGAYETNRQSTAYISRREGKQYFAGGFFGGTSPEFIKIVQTISDNINIDMAKGIIAVWHDESHWNRYCIDHEPTIILNPSYCYPESWDLPYPKKLLALDKNHAEMRE
jgi:histo-blood group ABO system transferase